MFAKTLIKTAIYRIGSLFLSFGLLYAFTGNITFSGGLSLVQLVASTIFYWCYEHLWEDEKVKLWLKSYLKM